MISAMYKSLITKPTTHIIHYQKIVGTEKEWVTLLTSTQVLST